MTQFGWQLAGETGAAGNVAAPPSRTILFESKHLILSLLAGGASKVPPHLHASHDEFGCMLDGGGELWVADERLALAPGATWAIPRGTPHRAVFTAPFRIVAWFTPWDDPAQPDRVECTMESQVAGA